MTIFNVWLACICVEFAIVSWCVLKFRQAFVWRDDTPMVVQSYPSGLASPETAIIPRINIWRPSKGMFSVASSQVSINSCCWNYTGQQRTWIYL